MRKVPLKEMKKQFLHIFISDRDECNPLESDNIDTTNSLLGKYSGQGYAKMCLVMLYSIL